MNGKSKKQIIIDLFNSIEWLPCNDIKDYLRTKIITSDDFIAAGLYGDIENAKQHCDVIYARRILQKMGYRVIIGGQFYIWEYKDKR